MFAFLPVSAGTGGQRSWPSRVLSLAVHAALIAVAVRFSEAGEAPPRETIAETTIVIDGRVPDDPGRPPAPAPLDGPAPLWSIQLPVDVPNTIPPVSDPLVDPVPGPVVSSFPPGTDSLRLTPPNPGTWIGTAPIDARVADEAPRLIDHPPVRYPEIMRQAGIEARVMVEAVLDTLGHAEPSSLRVVHSGGTAFDDEARAVVAGSRYRAARLAGRAVRVRIQVPVSFALRP